MKRIKLKLAFAGLLVGLIGIYSFTGDKAPKKGKRYEVIRSVDGKITIYDTIISAKSDYSPQNYLEDLGYADDASIKIIDISETLEGLNIEMDAHTEGEAIHKMVFISDDSMDHHTYRSTDHPQGMVIKKEIITQSENGEETIHFETRIGPENIDSLIKTLKVDDSELSVILEQITLSCDSLLENGNFRVMKIDEMHEGELDLNEITHEKILEMIKLDDSVKILTDVKVIEIDANEVVDLSGDHDRQVIVKSTSNTEDFTMVIVSEVNAKNQKRSEVKNSVDLTVSVYPNPANNTANMALNFSKKAATTIQVVDLNGKVIYQENLGELNGNYQHEFDLSNWSKGIYLIKVTHGEDIINEKLILE